MSIKRYAVKSGSRQSIQNTRDAIRAMEPFKTSGSLFGERGSFGLRWHHYLNRDEVAEYLRVANDILYTVVSYDTPIAWAYRVLADGTLPAPGQAAQGEAWHVVSQKFSPTTTAHQSVVQAALNGRTATFGPIWQDSAIPFSELGR